MGNFALNYRQVFVLALLGAAGVVLRFLVDQLFATTPARIFPLSTFLINIVGSFLIGLLFAWSMQAQLLSKELVILLAVGFLGGFTTFSAYTWQSLSLLESKNYFWAIIYFVGSPIVGLGSAYLGRIVGALGVVG